jgi:hypothetical protein
MYDLTLYDAIALVGLGFCVFAFVVGMCLRGEN